jgi:hypothetical protein
MSIREPFRHFPRPATPDDLPPEMRDAVMPHHPCLPLLLIPPQRYPFRRTRWGVELPFGWRTTPLRTLAVTEDETIILIEVDPQQTLTTTVIPVAALIHIHVYEILLYAFIELTWVEAGAIQTSTVEYNKVAQRYVDALLKQVRVMFRPHPGIPAQADTDLRDYPLKFQNWLRGSLLPDERLCATVYQPAIRQERRWIDHFLSPNRVIALTDRSVIVVEDRRNRWRAALTENYAILRDFFPLDQIQAITWDSGLEADWLRLRVGIGPGVYEPSWPLLPPCTDRLRPALESLTHAAQPG